VSTLKELSDSTGQLLSSVIEDASSVVGTVAGAVEDVVRGGIEEAANLVDTVRGSSKKKQKGHHGFPLIIILAAVLGLGFFVMRRRRHAGSDSPAGSDGVRPPATGAPFA
jgi:hypothetical protein